MDKHEYWFLHAALLNDVPSHFLMRQDVLEHDLNDDWHGLDSAEVVRILDTLFQRGDILSGGRYGVGVSGFVPTRSEIRAALMEGKDIDDRVAQRAIFGYHLTPQGGARWEAASQPDWNRFYDSRGYLPTSCWADYEQMEATSKKWIETVLRCHYGGMSAIAGTEHWEMRIPWQPTYWKLLPMGHRLVFQAQCECFQPYSWYHTLLKE